jgi:hypothetical protein
VKAPDDAMQELGVALGQEAWEGLLLMDQWAVVVA